MKTIKINEKEYQVEFTFEAADYKGLVQAMFNVMSGSYIFKNGMEHGKDMSQERSAMAMIDGVSEMVGDLPHICHTAFYAGLLEHHKTTEAEAKKLMRLYMTENSFSYIQLYEELRKCMEEDGFFDLSGLTGMLQKMKATSGVQIEEAQKS